MLLAAAAPVPAVALPQRRCMRSTTPPLKTATSSLAACPAQGAAALPQGLLFQQGRCQAVHTLVSGSRRTAAVLAAAHGCSMLCLLCLPHARLPVWPSCPLQRRQHLPRCEGPEGLQSLVSVCCLPSGPLRTGPGGVSRSGLAWAGRVLLPACTLPAACAGVAHLPPCLPPVLQRQRLHHARPAGPVGVPAHAHTDPPHAAQPFLELGGSKACRVRVKRPAPATRHASPRASHADSCLSACRRH